MKASVKRERRLLRDGPAPGEQPDPPLIDRVLVSCPGNAAVVLDRAREVLAIVLGQIGGESLTPDNWRGMLPVWFVTACAPERSPEDIDPWDAEASRIPHDQLFQWVLRHPRPPRRDLSEDAAWSVGGFVWWFSPEERQWWWWDAHVQDADTLIIELLIDDDYAYGALEWLLRVAGATSTESDFGYGHV